MNNNNNNNSNYKSKEPIAIIGIGCRFPGSINSYRDFIQIIKNGTDCLTEIPLNRWDSEVLSVKEKSITNKLGGFLNDIDSFDNTFFGISPKEAQQMDPQQRLLLHIIMEAMEDAKYSMNQIKGKNIGVFIGSSSSDYSKGIDISETNQFSTPGSNSSFLSNRLSYFLDVNGPSMTVNTACSSSLVAIHLGANAIWRGDCTASFVGGCNIISSPNQTLDYGAAGLLNQDQNSRCYSFDSRANGYVRSEGGGILILKSLSQAIIDNDNIYSLILNTGTNSNGRTASGITAPNSASQEQLLCKLIEESNIDPNKIGYFECHGTGTQMGDLNELTAIGSAIGKKKCDPLVIGSVKSQMGHLEGASGICGLIKAIICINENFLPIQSHFITENPNIPFNELNLSVLKSTTNWSQEQKIVGVNSFGVGGTNSSIFISSNYFKSVINNNNTIINNNNETEIFNISVNGDNQDLRERVNDIKDFILNSNYSLKELCYTGNVRTNQLENRISIQTQSKEDLIEKLEKFLNGKNHIDIIVNSEERISRLKLAFLYSGQGQQWIQMGKKLIECSSIFRNEFTKCSSIFQSISGWSIMEKLFDTKNKESAINDTWLAQPSIFAIQVSLSAFLSSLGIKPQIVIGHSLGELSAAYIAGYLTLEDTIKILWIRSHLQHKTTGTGKMLVVMKSKEEILKIIHQYGLSNNIEISGNNSGKWVGISGDIQSIDTFIVHLDKEGVTHRAVKINAGFHCHLMDAIKDDFYRIFNSSNLTSLVPNKTVQFYSTTFGSILTPSECKSKLATADYWWSNIRKSVLFKEAFTDLLEKEANRIDGFLEISAHPVISYFSNQIIKDLDIKNQLFTYPTMKKDEFDLSTIQRTLANLFTIGYDIKWSGLYPHNSFPIVRDFPRRRWKSNKFWIENPQKQIDRLSPPKYFSIDKTLFTNAPSFQVKLDHERFNYLKDHVIQGQEILPFAFYVEFVHASLSELPLPSKSYEIQDLNVNSSVSLGSKGNILSISFNTSLTEFIISVLDSVLPQKWNHISNGKVKYHTLPLEQKPLQIDEDISPLHEYSKEEFYEAIEIFGYHYKDSFQSIKNCKILNEDSQLSTIQLPQNSLLNHQSKYFNSFHPCLFDAVLQATFMPSCFQMKHSGMWIPQTLGRMKLSSYPLGLDIRSNIFCKSNLIKYVDSSSFTSDIKIYNQDGILLSEINNLVMKFIPNANSGSSTPFHLMNSNVTNTIYEWVPQDNDYVNPPSNSPLPTIILSHSDNEILVQSLKNDSILHQCQSIEEIESNSCVRIIILPSLFECQDYEQSNITLLNIYQIIIEKGLTGELYLVTNGAQYVLPVDNIQLEQYSLIGLTRVFCNEYPPIKTTMIDIENNQTKESLALLNNIISKKSNKKWEIAIRNQREYSYILSPFQEPIKKESIEERSSKKYQVEIGKNGVLSDITINESKIPIRQLDNDEVQVKVEFSSLNFRDILKSLGRDYDSNTVSTIGDEFSGTIVQLGSDCTEFKVGDKVFGILMAGSLSNLIRCKKDLLFKVPEHLSMSDCCTIPITFLTSYYSIIIQGRLRKGEKILIHSAAGGVGLSALQLAKHIGADIYVTVGSKEKREYLIKEFNLDPSHIFDSRSLTFYKDLMKATNNLGVDMVLNQLSGDFIELSIQCLARYGRFIEIGKKDIYSDQKLGLLPFKNNLTYYAVDIAQMTESKRDYLAEMMADMLQLFKSGILKPLHHKVFPIKDIVHSIRTMSQGNHIGKILLEWESVYNNDECKVIDLDLQFSHSHSYMITGFGGLSQTLALDFVKRFNLKHLIIVSRSGINTPHKQSIVDQLKSYGTKVYVFSIDLSQHANVEKLFKSSEFNEIPPLRGIFHTAGELCDSKIKNLSQDDFLKPFQSKAMSAFYLHQASMNMELDYFVMIGSVTAILGNIGQSNYSSSNRFIEGLAHIRNNMGMKATCIHMGPIPEIGMASNKSVRNHLIKKGFIPYPSLQMMLDGLRTLLTHNNAFIYGDINLENWIIEQPNFRGISNFHQGYSSPICSSGCLSPNIDEYKPVFDSLEVENSLKKILSEILEMKVDLVNSNSPLYNYGLDSLLSSELSNTIQKKYGIFISSLVLLEKSTNLLKLLSIIESNESNSTANSPKRPTIMKSGTTSPNNSPNDSISAINTIHINQSTFNAKNFNLPNNIASILSSPIPSSNSSTPILSLKPDLFSTSKTLSPNSIMTSPPSESPKDSPKKFHPNRNSKLENIDLSHYDPNDLCTVIYEIAPIAAPYHKYQKEMAKEFSKNTDEKEFLSKVYDNCKITDRYFFHKETDKVSHMTTSEKCQMFKNLIIESVVKAGESVIQKANIDRSKISYVIGVTSTGMIAPSIDTILIRELGLPSTTGRTMINFMGCGAAVIAMRTASVHAKARPGTFVLVVAVETSSINIGTKANDRADLISQCIFSDGTAATLVTTQPKHNVIGKLRIIDERSYLIDSSENALSMFIGNFGIDLTLRPELARAIELNVFNATTEFLKDNNLNISDIDFWAIHPGGRKILEAVQTGLFLSPEDISESYEVMKKYGNMVSCTAFYVLRRIMEKNLIFQDEGSIGLKHGIMMAFSPGASIETILLSKI